MQKEKNEVSETSMPENGKPEKGKPDQKEKKEKNGKKTALRVLIIVFSILAGLILLGICVYHGVVDYYLSKINYETDGQEDLIYETQRIVEEIPEETEAEASTSEKNPEQTEEQPADQPAMEEIDLHGTYGTKDLPRICDTKDVTNVLLLATDARKKGTAGLSDVMMLVSINQKTGKIVLCSFLRDLYAHYPTSPKNPINGGYDKLNHAHAYGGPTLTMAVLKETFNIDVKYYAKVDFSAFVEVVDAMGGLDLYLSAAEVSFINKNEAGSAADSGNKGYTVSPLKAQAGVHHLNGVQALTHARNRTIGSDFQRTERQRALISAMITKAKSLSLSQMMNLLDVFLPLITTNMTKDMLKDMVGNLPAMLGYEIESTKIPQEGTYNSINYNLIPNLKKNCLPLYEKIYGEAPKAK